MSAKIKYIDELLDEIRFAPDFLPSLSELAFCEEGVKVMLTLSKKSVEFFKAEASRHHTQYQRMIRRLLDAYVYTQPRPLTRRAARVLASGQLVRFGWKNARIRKEHERAA